MQNFLKLDLLGWYGWPWMWSGAMKKKKKKKIQGGRPLEGKKGKEKNLWFSCLISWNVLLQCDW